MMQEGSFGRITKKIAEPLQRVYLSNERLIKLVNDLLDLSRMEGGRMRYDMKPARFSFLITSVTEEFQQIAQSKGIALHFKKESGDPPARFDEEKMRQVVFNLVDNAVRYTPRGGSITVTLTLNPYHLLFSVADTGIGLGKQEINGLFQKFVRNREVARIHTEGVGLGLYVARRIVEDHGGRIWAESAGKGKGSTFFVELPMKKITL
jgi:signal transduction histidine kinase